MATSGDILIRDGDLFIRVMRDSPDDYQLITGWLAQEHVHEWWDHDAPPLAYDAVVAEYRSQAGGDSPTQSCIIEIASRPVGHIQFYPWAAYADELAETGAVLPDGSWGIDVFIGEPDCVELGLGSRTVRLTCEYLIAERDAVAVALLVAKANPRAQRAYLKAGMEQTGEALDTDIKDGERVPCFVMVRYDSPATTARISSP